MATPSEQATTRFVKAIEAPQAYLVRWKRTGGDICTLVRGLSDVALTMQARSGCSNPGDLTILALYDGESPQVVDPTCYSTSYSWLPSTQIPQLPRLAVATLNAVVDGSGNREEMNWGGRPSGG